MTDATRQFLERLASEKQGRCGFEQAVWDRIHPTIEGLARRGLIKERRLLFSPGVQITDKGRAWLAGEAE